MANVTNPHDFDVLFRGETLQPGDSAEVDGELSRAERLFFGIDKPGAKVTRKSTEEPKPEEPKPATTGGQASAAKKS